MNLRKVVDDAQSDIRTGWPDCTCLVLALDYAVVKHGGVEDGPYSSVTIKFLKDLGFEDEYEAFNWNDAPKRKKSEVIAKLESLVVDDGA